MRGRARRLMKGTFATCTAAVLVLHVGWTSAFAPAGTAGGGALAALSLSRRSSVGRPALALCMQANWINIVAEQQQRDPSRLAPLKPLPTVIQVRTPQKREYGTDELPYSSGVLGMQQKVNPGDFSPDMMKVFELAREVGGYGDQEIFQMQYLGQGFRSYVVAEDTRSGEIVGCAQLTRIQVGGYLYLTDDLQIQHVFVKPEYRRLGIANHMVHELLGRVKPNQRAWAWADRESDAFYALFASGFVGITYQECGRVFPFILWLLLWPFHRVGLTKPQNVFFAAEGRGDMGAYNPAG